MGLIARIFGIGEAAKGVGSAVESVAEVFTVNKTKAELAHWAQSQASLAQYSAEFTHANQGWFDRFINGINRLPRPVMALGTVGLFVFAMADPTGFAGRMQGLAYVPDPLWWLLGAVVSFYFGARELHYARQNIRPITLPKLGANQTAPLITQAAENPALAEWQQAQG
ncbi:MAG: holin family protein [Paracoccaceae bacterium]